MPPAIPGFVDVHPRALAAFQSLPDEERAKVAERFQAIRPLPPERWAHQGVRPLKDDPNVYLSPVGPSLLLFFSVTTDGFLIEDFVRQETLDRFFAAGASAGQP